MSKIISITMAVIIMLTANITAPVTYAATPQTITASVKAKPSSHKKKKKHKIGKNYKVLKSAFLKWCSERHFD